MRFVPHRVSARSFGEQSNGIGVAVSLCVTRIRSKFSRNREPTAIRWSSSPRVPFANARPRPTRLAAIPTTRSRRRHADAPASSPPRSGRWTVRFSAELFIVFRSAQHTLVDVAESPRVAKLEIDTAAVLGPLCVLEIHEHALRGFDHEVQASSDGRMDTAVERYRGIAIQCRRA
jgi:hypothetical protein